MRRARMLAFNIIATTILAILVAWLGLFALCQYNPYSTLCRQGYAYPLVGSIVACIVLFVFFWHQYDATRALWKAKGHHSTPHIISRYNTLERAVMAVWNVWNMDDNLVESIALDDMEDYGWVIEFTNNSYPVIVSQKELYYWLLDVARRQGQIEAIGRRAKDSPLSQRNNPELSRKRLMTYIKLLETVNAIEYLNPNVKRLKPSYAADVWTKIIKPLERIQPVVRI